jgi:hypothetical protein
MMFAYLDNLFHSATKLGCLILVTTTCILMIYLLFNMTKLIEYLMQRNDKHETNVLVGDKEIQINIGNSTVEFNFGKIKRLFWWMIGITYTVGIALCFAVIVVIPLVLVLIFGAKKLLKTGMNKGIKSVFRLPSPR